jgi:hypothetical protein
MSWIRFGLLLAALFAFANLSSSGQATASGQETVSAADTTASGSKTAPDLKIFEAATGLANTLTSWAFVMIGGSILAILGTGYYRPSSLWIRCTYFAFVPAWFFLSWSVYAGTRVQSVYLAALFSAKPKIDVLKNALNTDSLAQIDRMEIGLGCFGVWLTLYIIWWIFNKEEVKP